MTARPVAKREPAGVGSAVVPSPRMALAFREDALAIASWASSLGYEEDAEAMRAFAARLAPLTVSLRGRWAAREGRAG